MIKSLHAFRGLFAIIIYLHHYCLSYDLSHFGGGASSVVFFFILSGFVISAGYQDKFLNNRSSISIKEFAYKRITRFYPLHIFGALMWLLVFGTLDASQLNIYSSNLLLLHSWIPVKAYFFSLNGVSWYLSTLLFCYLAYPLLTQIIKYAKQNILTGTCVIGALSIVYCMVVFFIPEEYEFWTIYINPLMRIFDFILGILLWNMLSDFQKNKFQISKRNSTQAASLLQLVAIFIMCGSYIVYCLTDLSERFSLVSYWWLPCLLLIATFYLFDEYDTYLNRILKLRAVQRFADLSFAFFMIHQTFIYTWGYYLGGTFIAGSKALTLIFVFVAVTVLAWFVNKYIEIGIPRLLSKRRSLTGLLAKQN